MLSNTNGKRAYNKATYHKHKAKAPGHAQRGKRGQAPEDRKDNSFVLGK
jgi:hypothetical protein